jgi:hypothetical protein
MNGLPNRFVEDRALRDAARAVLAEDFAHLRASLAEDGIGSRVSAGVTATVSSRIRTGARDVLAQARSQAADNKGVLAVLIGAIILFLARGPIFDWIEELGGAADNEAEDEAALAVPDPATEGDPA